MAMIQVVPPTDGSIGGTIQGEYGTYTESADGTFTIDSRDAASLMTLGFIHAPAAPPASSGATSEAHSTVSHAGSHTPNTASKK